MGAKREAESGKHEARPAASVHPSPPSNPEPEPDANADSCEVCGVAALVWRKCKLICENCGSVNKSCSDL